MTQDSNSEYAARIFERQKFLERVIRSLDKYGPQERIVLESKVKDFSTFERWVVLGWNDFSFEYAGVYSSMGGENLHIWYHPGVDAADRNDAHRVLSLRWQIPSRCTADLFANDTTWQAALTPLLDDLKEQEGREDEWIRAALEANASRLGVRP
jgi:hypothetical protein